MTARLIDGRALARRMRTELREEVAAHTADSGDAPCMVAIASAADPAAETYFTLKLDAARSTGIQFVPVLLPAGATTGDAVREVQRAADDPAAHGIFLQYPLPRIDADACNRAIPVAKDIDGANPETIERLRSGADVFPAASAVAILALLEYGGIGLSGRIAFVGRGAPAIAEPLVVLLERAGARVERPGTATRERMRDAMAGCDVIVFPAGLPPELQPAWLPAGAVVVDGGYFGRRRAGADILRAAAPRLSAYVPARGGVGPVTVSVLLRHTLSAARASR